MLNSIKNFKNKKGFKYPFEWCLGKAIESENKVCKNLEPFRKDYYIYHLNESGVRSHGSDIIISRHEELKDNVFDNVIESICAIEVLGIIKNGKNYFLGYHNSKNLMNWMVELNNYDILPIIAWIEPDTNKAMFFILEYETLVNVFYTNQANRFRQRKRCAPLVNAKPYSFPAELFFYYISVFEEIKNIIKTIDVNKPKVLQGINGQIWLNNENFASKDLNMYHKYINELRFV